MDSSSDIDWRRVESMARSALADKPKDRRGTRDGAVRSTVMSDVRRRDVIFLERSIHGRVNLAPDAGEPLIPDTLA